VLTHYADFDTPAFSKRNLIVNFVQTLLFVAIHRQYFITGMFLKIIPVFLLALLNGFIFIKTRNIAGCIMSHSTLNGSAIILHFLFIN
ncbi:MAG: CPBP family glutamic-type intramembrane protease, partial [Candidatus Ranarchaeia archaeon]